MMLLCDVLSLWHPVSDIGQGLYQSLLNKHDLNFEKAETFHKMSLLITIPQ